MTSEQKLWDVSSEITAPGVVWSSIFAGAATIASLSLILLILGIGLGFTAMSPWSNNGLHASTIGISSIIWLAVTQLIASGLGGYLSGRLRIKWATVHDDEVYFRDTAHGFLAWAVASLSTAVLLGAVIGNVVASDISKSTSVATQLQGLAINKVVAGAEKPNFSMLPSSSLHSNDSDLDYHIDLLFRTEPSASNMAVNESHAARQEARRIFVNALHSKTLSPEDAHYLVNITVARTGLSSLDSSKRINEVFNQVLVAINTAEQGAKVVADNARKAVAYSSLWMFVALLSGAFAASLAAIFGGRQRDQVIHNSLKPVN